MLRPIYYALGLSMLMMLGTAVLANNPEMVVIKWRDAQCYSDVMAGRENQKQFEKRVFEQLGNYIKTEAAKLLKPGQRLLVTVYDLDLAGEVRMGVLGPGEDVRVIHEPLLTMIDLEYRLLDRTNKQLLMGRDKMRGSWSHRFGLNAVRNRSFNYEKHLISDWLNKKVKPKLASLK